jgi:hypothetical protein
MKDGFKIFVPTFAQARNLRTNIWEPDGVSGAEDFGSTARSRR